MKRSFAILICLILILGFCACKSTASTESQTGGEDVRNDNTSKNESVGISVPVSDGGNRGADKTHNFRTTEFKV